MKIDVSEIIQKLDLKEINVLLKLYYYQEGVLNSSNDFEDETISSLTKKELITIDIGSNKNVLDLTDYGIDVCGTVMINRINKNSVHFKEETNKLPERAVSCFVNRILWKDTGLENISIQDPFDYDEAIKNENLWYERVLLHDERFGNALEKFYNILEDFEFIENLDGQRWCLPEVENYLRDEYKKIMNLSWAEEDSLKYYQFLFTYSKETKNLIDFTGSNNEYLSMYYHKKRRPVNFIKPAYGSICDMIIDNFGLKKRRIINFFEEMKQEGIVSFRDYPPDHTPMFINNYRLFVINNIRDYMDYINIHFLKPVVDSLLN